jgi:hypothetical protein
VIPAAFLETYVATCRVQHRLAEVIGTCVCAGLGALLFAAFAGRSFGLVGFAGGWLVAEAAAGCWAAWRLSRLLGVPIDLRLAPRRTLAPAGSWAEEGPSR